MRRAQGPPRDELAPDGEPRDAVDARDGDGLRAAERRQDRRQAPSQHRLARPWRPREQEVVRARRRDRQRADRRRMPAHVGEVDGIGGLGARRRRRRCGRRLRHRSAAQDRGDLAQARHARDHEPLDQRRLACALARDDEPRDLRTSGALRDSEHAAAVTQLATERQLAEDRPALQVLGRDLLGCREQPAGGCEVEAGTDLAQVRGREVDRDAPLRKREARVQQCGMDALARLTHGRVAAADDREGRQAGTQVDLDGDSPRGEAVDRESCDAGEHATQARRLRVTKHHLIATNHA